MKSEARYIELVLENVETIIININDIKSMSLFNVCEKHSVGISSSKNKNIEIIKECSKCILCLKKTANVFKENLQGGMNVFERIIKFSDICYIDYLNSKKEVIDSIYVPWDFDEEKYYTNSFQTSEVQEDESLLIIIKPKESIKDWTLRTMKKYPELMKKLAAYTNDSDDFDKRFDEKFGTGTDVFDVDEYMKRMKEMKEFK